METKPEFVKNNNNPTTTPSAEDPLPKRDTTTGKRNQKQRAPDTTPSTNVNDNTNNNNNNNANNNNVNNNNNNANNNNNNEKRNDPLEPDEPQPFGDGRSRNQVDWSKLTGEKFYEKYIEIESAQEFDLLPELTGLFEVHYRVGKKIADMRAQQKSKQRNSNMNTAGEAIKQMAAQSTGEYIIKKGGKVTIDFTSNEYKSKLLAVADLSSLNESARSRASKVLTKERMEMIPGNSIAEKNVACLSQWVVNRDVIPKLFKAAGFKDLKKVTRKDAGHEELGKNVKNASVIPLIDGTIIAIEIAKATGAESPTWRNFLYAFRDEFENVAKAARDNYDGSVDHKQLLNSGFFFGLAFVSDRTSILEAMKFWVTLALPAVWMVNTEKIEMRNAPIASMLNRAGRVKLAASVKALEQSNATEEDKINFLATGSGAIVIDPLKIMSFTSDPNADLRTIQIQCSILLDHWLKRDYILTIPRGYDTAKAIQQMNSRDDSPYSRYNKKKVEVLLKLKSEKIKSLSRSERRSRPSIDDEEVSDSVWVNSSNYLD